MQLCVCTLSPGGGFAVETLRFAGTDAHPVSALARTNTPPRLPARLQRYTYCTGLPTTRAECTSCMNVTCMPGWSATMSCTCVIAARIATI